MNLKLQLLAATSASCPVTFMHLVHFASVIRQQDWSVINNYYSRKASSCTSSNSRGLQIRVHKIQRGLIVVSTDGLKK